jgi:3-isopropylmalate/(R)-2-methylmalate dehydratase small subunit
MIISARAIKFGDNVDTDVILPGKYLVLTDPVELGKHAMEGISRDFVTKSSKGSILVAGKNFGQGSSREQAPVALKAAGVRCVLADSFARIFYRNAFNIGLPLLECPGISSEVEQGDALSIDLERGKINDETKGLTITASPIPDFLLAILEDGGIIEHLRRRSGLQSSASSYQSTL